MNESIQHQWNKYHCHSYVSHSNNSIPSSKINSEHVLSLRKIIVDVNIKWWVSWRSKALKAKRCFDGKKENKKTVRKRPGTYIVVMTFSQRLLVTNYVVVKSFIFPSSKVLKARAQIFCCVTINKERVCNLIYFFFSTYPQNVSFNDAMHNEMISLIFHN